MRSKRHPQVVNVDEVESIGRIKGRFGATAKRLAAPAGASKIGCNWMELQPGKTSFPYHYHTGIEEGLFILAGSGELRIGKDTVAVGQGDYVAFPAGPDYAHALTNSSSALKPNRSINARTKNPVLSASTTAKVAGPHELCPTPCTPTRRRNATMSPMSGSA